MTLKQARSSDTTPVVYDFRRPMTLARDHARVLEVALTTFARQWANQLLGSLRQPTQMSLDSVEMCSYEEYITSLPQRTTLAVCTVGVSRRPALVQFSLAAALTWIDLMLGGPGKADTIPERDLTDIEQALVSDVMRRVLTDLDYAFSGVIEVDAELRNIQHSPQLVQATAATTSVIVGRFTVTVGDIDASATLMLPAEGLINALREKEVVETRTADELEAERAQHALLDLAVQRAPVDISVRLPPVPVQPRDVVSLSVGDVIPLHHPSARPMEVVVGDRVLAQAVAGTSGSRLAGLVVNVKENS